MCSAIRDLRRPLRLRESAGWSLLQCSEPASLVTECGEGVPMRMWTWAVG